MPEDKDSAETNVAPKIAVLNVETLEEHRTIIHLREWIAAQTPWRRGLARVVSERISDAA
jgi:hypothetical protein